MSPLLFAQLVMRPVALVVPDTKAIIEATLFMNGYQKYKPLAAKLTIFMDVIKSQVRIGVSVKMTTFLSIVWCRLLPSNAMTSSVLCCDRCLARRSMTSGWSWSALCWRWRVSSCMLSWTTRTVCSPVVRSAPPPSLVSQQPVAALLLSASCVSQCIMNFIFYISPECACVVTCFWIFHYCCFSFNKNTTHNVYICCMKICWPLFVNFIFNHWHSFVLLN